MCSTAAQAAHRSLKNRAARQLSCLLHHSLVRHLLSNLKGKKSVKQRPRLQIPVSYVFAYSAPTYNCLEFVAHFHGLSLHLNLKARSNFQKNCLLDSSGPLSRLVALYLAFHCQLCHKCLVCYTPHTTLRAFGKAIAEKANVKFFLASQRTV